jgi:hypothetical protein
MGEFGRSGPQVPHDEAAQREHLNEIEEDLRHDRQADRVAKGRARPPRWRFGYLVVFVGAAGFVASCFLPYNGVTSSPGDPRSVSIYEQLVSFGPNDGGSDVGALLFLFGGVASVAVVAAVGVTRGRLRPGAASVAAAVAVWSLTWIGLMIREATFGGGISLRWGFWVQAVSVGVVVVGTIVAVATERVGAQIGGDVDR